MSILIQIDNAALAKFLLEQDGDWDEELEMDTYTVISVYGNYRTTWFELQPVGEI